MRLRMNLSKQARREQSTCVTNVFVLLSPISSRSVMFKFLSYLLFRFCLVKIQLAFRLDRRHSSLHPDNRNAPVTTLTIGQRWSRENNKGCGFVERAELWEV